MEAATRARQSPARRPRRSATTSATSWTSPFTLAVTEWKLRFFGSVLGYLWTLMRPLLLFGVLYVVFTHVVKVGTTIPHYPATCSSRSSCSSSSRTPLAGGLQPASQREYAAPQGALPANGGPAVAWC